MRPSTGGICIAAAMVIVSCTSTSGSDADPAIDAGAFVAEPTASSTSSIDAEASTAEPAASSTSPGASDGPLPVATGSNLEPLPLVPLFHEVMTTDPVVFRAVEAAIQTCMAQQGFEYVPAEPPTGLRIDVTDGVATDMQRFVPDGPDQDSGAGEPGMQQANPAWAALDTDEQRQAWERAHDGTVLGQVAREGAVTVDLPEGGSVELPGGCLGKAQQAVVDERTEQRQLQFEFQELYNGARERVKSDPLVREITREWSRCLAERGFQYATLDGALEEASGREEPLGQAIGSCAVEVDWARRVNPVEVEVHEQVIAENEGLIASLADQREAARQRARELLGEG